MKRLVALLAAVFSISLAGSLVAMTLEPQAALPQSQPVILGEISEVGNHTVTVMAPGEEQMAFEFDSRTVMPASLENGERVKVEYRILDSGLHLAQRVTPLSVGSRDWETLERQMSMVPEGGDHEGSSMLVASTAPESGENPARAEEVSSTTQQPNNETPSQQQPETSQEQGGSTTTKEHQEMPRTASPLPWLLVSSGVLMFLVGGLWLARRGRAA